MFERRLRMMNSRDGIIAEEGFGEILTHIEEHLEDLIAVFQAELSKPEGERINTSWIVELISESGSEAALPTLVEQLYSFDSSLHFWAVRGLEKIGTKEARIELWKARANGILQERPGT
jgi:hypothetical protein